MLLFQEIVVAMLEMGHEAPNLRIRLNTTLRRYRVGSINRSYYCINTFPLKPTRLAFVVDIILLKTGTSAWPSYRCGEGCGVCRDSVGLFSPCLNTRFCSRVSGQRRRGENAEMVTKAMFWITCERILSQVRRNHVLDDTWNAAYRFYVIIPPRALSDTGTDVPTWVRYTYSEYFLMQIHTYSQWVAFILPRVTFFHP